MNGKLIATSVALALVHSATAYALPDKTSGNPLSKLGITTPAGVGDVVKDHENPRTLYVGPANDKEIIGTYFDMGGGPSCSSYVALKQQANYIPETPDLRQQAIDNGDFVSNLFQLTYALSAKNTVVVNDISEFSHRIRELARENGGIIERYEIVESQWDDINLQLERSERELNLLRNEQQSASLDCVSRFMTDQPKLVQCIGEVADKYTLLLTEATQNVREQQNRQDEIRDEYLELRGLNSAYERKKDDIDDEIAFIRKLYDFQTMIVEDAYELERKTVAESGNLIAGIASAGYNLWGNEASILSNTLRGRGYEVQQLNVFDIRLNSGVTRDNANTILDDNQPIYRKNVWTYPSNTIINFGQIGDKAMPFERETLGEQIHFDTTTWDSLGSGGIDFHVTKDARCGDYERNVEHNYTATNDGETASWKVIRDEYKPVLNSPVFSTDIALSYSYYAYPGKMEGECSINVDRANSYFRSAGSSKSWSWFKTKTKSWDDIVKTARENLGMECNLSVVPQSNDPEEAARIAEKFESEMYNDMWQMFLAVYAESYDLIVKDPNVIDPGKSEVGGQIGDGLMKVCPANMYCQFANVVLRALDTIGGSKAKGTTSYSAREYGKIWKRYNKDSFSVYQGSASIKAKVCVDSRRCN